jgi:hypothetical protein
VLNRYCHSQSAKKSSNERVSRKRNNDRYLADGFPLLAETQFTNEGPSGAVDYNVGASVIGPTNTFNAKIPAWQPTARFQGTFSAAPVSVQVRIGFFACTCSDPDPVSCPKIDSKMGGDFISAAPISKPLEQTRIVMAERNPMNSELLAESPERNPRF